MLLLDQDTPNSPQVYSLFRYIILKTFAMFPISSSLIHIADLSDLEISTKMNNKCRVQHLLLIRPIYTDVGQYFHSIIVISSH